MDLVGRKKAIIGGFALQGICLILMTRFSSVYPQLLIFYCVFSCGGVPSYTAPLLNDYVNPISIGIASFFGSIVSFVA